MLDRRRADLAGDRPSIFTALRRLRVQAMTIVDDETLADFQQRVHATIQLALADGREGLAAGLSRLLQEARAPGAFDAKRERFEEVMSVLLEQSSGVGRNK